MAYYALLDENNIVNQVISGIDETEDAPEGYEDWEDFYGQFHSLTCKRTSYNTLANTHRDEGTPFRGNYAGIGYTYDATNDVFIAPKPYSKWVLNESTWTWEAPVAMPDDGKQYIWNDNTGAWEEVAE